MAHGQSGVSEPVQLGSGIGSTGGPLTLPRDIAAKVFCKKEVQCNL
jgi:hypothetical protein